MLLCYMSGSSAELLASFCDNILKKGGNEKLNDETIEDTLDKVVKLLAYVSDKDLYAKFYRNLANRQKPGCGKGTGVDQSRTNMTNAVTKKFKDLMIEFQTLRQRIQDEYREVVERRVITDQMKRQPTT
ncbi:unnamed protein product [Camellia sinensis]